MMIKTQYINNIEKSDEIKNTKENERRKSFSGCESGKF
jgi:hypothetical protein